MAAFCRGSTFPRKTSLEEVERAMVELAMRQANGNQTHAARLLDISRDALRYKLKKFELVPAGDEEAAPDWSPPKTHPTKTSSQLIPVKKRASFWEAPWCQYERLLRSASTLTKC